MSTCQFIPVKRTAGTLPSFTPVRSGLLQRKCRCDGTPRPTREHAERSRKKRFGLRAKFKVNEPGDIYEQEADRVADQVMQRPASQLAMSTARLPTTDRDTRFPEKQAPQTTSAVFPEAAARKAPGIVDQALRSPGQPLDASARSHFEPRFGLDFSTVRVHTDDAAMHSTAAIGARAYTYGSHILFAAGERPGADRLTAHELTHVAQNVSGDELPGIRRTSGPDPYEIISPVWNVGGRDVVIVRMKADGRTFFFYRRSGRGSKGKFEPFAAQKGRWVPFEGFEEVEALELKGLEEIKQLGELERLAKLQNLPGEYVSTYRFHKEPYYYAPDVKASRVAPSYGTQTHKGIAEWLDRELPPGRIKGEVANWGDVQKVLEKHAPRNLPFPGEEAPQPAISRSGEIGRPGRPRSGPSGGGTVEAMVEETTERIVKRVPTVPKPQSPIESPFPGSGMPEPVPEPRPGIGARLKAGFSPKNIRAGLRAVVSAENIASMIPDVVLMIADKVAAREAVRRIRIKFAKEGFAKGFAAGVTGWSKEEVRLNLKNRVTSYRVQGLEDPAGFLTKARIFQLADEQENYAVDLGYQFTSSHTLKWKRDMLARGSAALAKYGYPFGEVTGPAVKRVHLGNVIVEEELDPAEAGPQSKPRYLFEYGFIDKLAWVLRPTTNPIIEAAIEKGEERKAAEARKMRPETGGVGM